MYMQKNESGYRPYTLHKNELKIDFTLKCKAQDDKTLRMEETQDYLSYGKTFLDITQKTWSMKKTDNPNFIKIKNFCSAKDIFKRRRAID